MRKRTRIIQDKRRRTRCAQLAADAFDEKLISVREEDGRTEIIMEGDAVTDMCGSTLFIQEPDTGDIFSENLKSISIPIGPGGKKLAVPNIYGFYPVQKVRVSALPGWVKIRMDRPCAAVRNIPGI